MICFLTSRVDLPGGETLNPANHFIDEIRRFFPVRGRGLYICSDPDGWEKMDFYAGLTRAYFENSGFPFDRFLTLDSRNESLAEELIRESNVLILSGGHVPTQNRFFRKIDLRELLRSYSGLLFGISAGSMNSADIVYAQPELEGEATDPAYERFLPGLGLTKTMLLPHYQEVKDNELDGMRLFEGITFSDSLGHTFYVLPDGSYLLLGPGGEELRGEAYRIRDGRMEQIAAEGDSVPLK